jgi:hypothetical protein
MNLRRLPLLIILMAAATQLHAQSTWNDKLVHALPYLGHRNWIVIADPAYPLSSSLGIEVMTTNLSQTDLLSAVLTALSHAPHVRPVFYTAAELPFVREEDAHGIGACRAQIAGLLAGGTIVTSTGQDQLMAKMEEESRSYRVLVLKSTTNLPYTAVFIQLDSGYWSADAEKRLRAAMQPK